jgi:uncharacterized membrane protein YkoI
LDHASSIGMPAGSSRRRGRRSPLPDGPNPSLARVVVSGHHAGEHVDPAQHHKLHPATRPKLLLVAIGMALLVAGCVSPREATTTDNGGVAAGVEPIAASDQPTEQGETGSERESGDDTPLSGAAAERAKAAAQAAVPGATVREVERDSEDGSGGGYEVELTRPDGSTVKVRLDASYRVIETAREGRDD